MEGELESKTYTYKSGAVYEGTFRGTKRHGRGLWKHPEGERYEGEYAENKQNGLGVYVYAHAKKSYFGAWAGGVMEGRGVYFFDEGRESFYCGEYHDDKKHGEGFYKYDNGVLAKQQWESGEMASEREATPAEAVTCAHSVYTIMREVARVAPQELGELPPEPEPKTFQFPSGATYSGEYHKTHKHGKGYWVHPEGDSYDGMFRGNRHHGWGVYTSGRSGKRYVGQWAEGVMHGWGVYFFNAAETEYYVGQYRNDVKHGLGVYHFAESQQHKLQLWANGELEKETDADGPQVQQYLEAVQALCDVAALYAPHYRAKTWAPRQGATQ